MASAMRLARRPPIAFSLALVAILVAPAQARAHALLVESSPADGAVLAAAPPRAILRFDSRIEGQLARAILRGPDGRATALEADGSAEPPDRVSFALPALAPGDYRLTYRVISVDGHATPGQIRFTIRTEPVAP
jgi:methionine-rich copper-binding protein CopC